MDFGISSSSDTRKYIFIVLVAKNLKIYLYKKYINYLTYVL